MTQSDRRALFVRARTPPHTPRGCHEGTAGVGGVSLHRHWLSLAFKHVDLDRERARTALAPTTALASDRYRRGMPGQRDRRGVDPLREQATVTRLATCPDDELGAGGQGSCKVRPQSLSGHFELCARTPPYPPVGVPPVGRPTHGAWGRAECSERCRPAGCRACRLSRAFTHVDLDRKAARRSRGWHSTWDACCRADAVVPFAGALEAPRRHEASEGFWACRASSRSSARMARAPHVDLGREIPFRRLPTRDLPRSPSTAGTSTFLAENVGDRGCG